VVAKSSIAIIAATLLVLLGLFGYWLLRRRARRKSSADDFPPTEIAPQEMDGPTLVLADQPTVIEAPETVAPPPGSAPASNAVQGPAASPAATEEPPAKPVLPPGDEGPAKL
jgi:hypothetical protein